MTRSPEGREYAAGVTKSLRIPPQVVYPDSDGQPIAEDEPNFFQATPLVLALDDHFAGDPEVHVGGNCFVYYEEGKPASNVAPDLYFVRGIADAKRRRRVYKVWEEGGKHPQFVLEVLSESTKNQDKLFKKALYHDVFESKEYVLVDVEGGNLPRPLVAYVWKRAGYVEADRAGRFESAVLGLELRLDGDGLVRLYDSGGKCVPGRGAEGLEIGRSEGRVAGLREALAIVLEARFGPIPRAARKRLDSIDDPARLTELTRRAGRVASLGELELGSG